MLTDKAYNYIKYGLNLLYIYPNCYGPYKQDLTSTKRGLVLVKN